MEDGYGYQHCNDFRDSGCLLGGDRGRPSRPRPGAATHRYGEARTDSQPR